MNFFEDHRNKAKQINAPFGAGSERLCLTNYLWYSKLQTYYIIDVGNLCIDLQGSKLKRISNKKCTI